MCSSGFGTDAAIAACRNLGLEATASDTIVALGSLFEQAEDPISTFNITGACENGACNFTNAQVSTKCPEASTKAGLFCRTPSVGTNCTTGDMRLVGGNSDSEGRLEICLDRQWGTVCDDSWDEQGAAVACRQLGYTYEG